MMTSNTESNLEMFNLVHKLAMLSKTSPESDQMTTTTVGFTSSPFIPGDDDHLSENYNRTFIPQRSNISPMNRPPVFSQSRSSNTNRIVNQNSGRRIQPVSAPRKPPDIQNMTLFPPINESMHDKNSAAVTFTNSQADNFSKSCKMSGFTSSANEKKLRDLEIKFQGRELKADDRGGGGGIDKEVKPETPNFDGIKKRLYPRSAELFADITPEIAGKIDKIANDYSSLLDHNLSQNILEEISLLLQLIALSHPLTSTELQYTNISSKIGKNLSTVAEQIFFVIKVLTLQLNSSLVSIDPEVIQLLVEKYPHRIPKPFRKNFQSWYQSQVEACKINATSLEPSRKPSEFHHCVTFRSETDGRSNFPSQGNFHAFCKQRDLFYSIKNLWEEGKNNIPDANSSFGNSNSSTSRNYPKQFKNGNSTSSTTREVDPLYGKVDALFRLNSSWVNLSHFAALFSAQYIIDSMEESRHKTVVQDEVMKVLQLSNPDRFTKLNNRMSSISELESKSKNCFDFQQYFITSAASPAFNQHLIDRLSFEIRQIESLLDTADTEAIAEDEEEFLMKKSVLIAKLLGYLSFLPYREDSANNTRSGNTTFDRETLSSKHIELRKHQIPSLELYSFLCNAIKRSRLTFTLPWIVEFLSAADYISLQLPAYEEIILLICCAYRNLCSVDEITFSNLCLANKNYLRFWCGILLSLDVVPSSVLYIETNLFEEIVKLQQSLMSQYRSENDVPMDGKAYLGERLSKYYFSVKFNQMKNILHSGMHQEQLPSTPFGNGSGQHRHIRPIPAKPSIKPTAMCTDVELQRQLECSFFDGHSASVKRTVDFISDRIASNYVKILRKTMSEQRVELARKGIFEENAAELCRKSMLQGVHNFISSKCQLSLNLLIGETLSLDALNVCQQIAERQTIDKVSHWIHIHIKAELFPEIPIPEVSAPEQKSADPESKTVTTADDNLSFSILIMLHSCIKKLHEKKPILDSSIDDILNCSGRLGSVPGLISTLIDFGITLIAVSPSILTAERQRKLIELWRPNWNPDCQLLSPRNVLILSTCCENVQLKSWSRLEEIILLLIKEKLLDFETVEQDCFRLLREDFSLKESKHISQLLKNLISSTSANVDGNYGPSREVVDWISWFCSENQDGEF